MCVDCKGMRGVLKEDNSVEFTDKNGSTVYRVSIPYMVDANFALTYDINVKVRNEQDECFITYIPSREWMESPDREYPIMLDPSVSTSEYKSNIEDTYVEEGSSINHSSEQYLYINKNGGGKKKIVMSVGNLPSVDSTMPIRSVRINLKAQ